MEELRKKEIKKMQTEREEEEEEEKKKCSPLLPPPALPPLGEVAALGAAAGVRWRRLPRLTEAQLLLREEEEDEKKGRKRESVPLHARLEGRLVPTSSPSNPSPSSTSSSAAAARLDRAHAAVVDGFLSERSRAELLSLVVFGGASGGTEGKEGGDKEKEKGKGKATARPQARTYDENSGGAGLPRPRWERRTADSVEAAAAEEEGGEGGSERRLGWGLSSAAIDDLLDLASSSSPASDPNRPPPPRSFAEIGSKLSAMFPEHDCLWLPSGSMEGREEEEERGGGNGGNFSTSPPLLANAASSSDAFSYHVDCDPDSTHPNTPWASAFGHYVNGEPNKPLLASIIIYLNASWSPSLGGETLILDSTAGVGCAVLPRPGRALIIESDVLHKVCPPSSSAGGRLRFSLVLKLALCPKKKNLNDKVNVLSRDWWGQPADLGSAKALSELVRKVGEERRRGGEKKRQQKHGGGEDGEEEDGGKERVEATKKQAKTGK